MKIPGKCLPPCLRKLLAKRVLCLSMLMAFTLCVMVCVSVGFAHADTGVAKSESDSTAPSPLAKRILSIRPETGEHGFKVHIIGDGKLKDYNAFRIERPHRLVIDLPGVQCSLGQKTLLVDSLLVKKIQVHTSNKDKVRIVFDLFPIAELPYKVFSKDNQLIVAFGSVAGSPVVKKTEKIQQVPPVSTSGKKEEAAGGYVQKTALPPARKITAVEIERDDQGTKMHIVADGELTRYDSFRLSDPARLVVDLFGVQSAVGKETMLFSNPLVKGVRLGTSYKDQVRVVFDLVPPGGLPYQIVLKGNRLVVFVEQKSDISTSVPAGKVQSTFPSSSAEQARATSAPVLPAGGKPFATVPPGKTILHISSFKEKENAEDELQRLGKHGYKTFLAPEQVLGESWLRVYIGDFKDEQEARKVGSELKRKGIISYFKPRTI